MRRQLIVLLKLENNHKDVEVSPPFGLLYLTSALKKAGFEVEIIHETGTPENIKKVLSRLLLLDPLFVGLSILTGPSLVPSLAASREIKKHSAMPVVWGGVFPSMVPQDILRSAFVDIVAIGEGEETVVELARHFAEKGSRAAALKDIRGIGYKENGMVTINPARPFIADLDLYAPAWDHVNVERYFFDYRSYFSEMGSRLPAGKIGTVMTSRGCPSRCGYCYNQFINKRKFRAHSVRHVIAEIEWLKKDHQISAVIFLDDNFFSDPKRALEIVRNLGLPWTASFRANYAALWGEDFFRKLRDSACMELRIGAESGSQRILNLMQKDIMVEDIRRSAELCQKYGIRALFNFMIGLPGEIWPDMLKTFQLMDDLGKMGDGVFAGGPLVYLPWPGTSLFDLAVEKGFHRPERLEEWAVNLGARQPATPYVDRRAKFVNYFRILAYRKSVEKLSFAWPAKVLSFLARKRWEKRAFRVPLDYYVPRFVFELLKILGMGKTFPSIYT
jgi:anaerobic magnesium-protoporphyrin IX monomethyl ester cyclase